MHLIEGLEAQNKQSPSPRITNDLFLARQNLCSLLVLKYESNLKLTKANFYSLGNKDGALLARRVKGQYAKTKITSLNHPPQNNSNPQEIVDAFSDSSLYSSLYNLHTDHSTPQPQKRLSKNF